MANNKEQIIGTNAITELLTDVRDWVMGKMPEIGPDAAGHDYVEIAGIKWATVNVGAESETDTGLYFQWGDIQGYTADQVGSGEGKKAFSWADYKYGTSQAMTKYNATDGKTVLDLEDDAAVANWGGSWRMPTTAEFQALGAAVNTAWTQVNNVYGILCTDKTDSSKTLFFPAAGYCGDGSVGSVGNDGNYWSSSLRTDDRQNAYSLNFDSYTAFWDNYNNRYYGYAVRAVLDDSITPSSKLHKVAVSGDYNDLENKPNDYYKKSEVDEKLAKTANAVSITWSELKTLRDGGNLIAGQWYRITDYATTTSQQDTQSAGHQFDIIVRADSPTVLNENACATRHEGDTYFQNAKLESWQLKYCLDNDSNRFAWSDSLGKGVVYGMIDEFGNECGYDFKNIQFKRYKVTSLSSNTSLQGLYAGYREINTSGSQGSLYPSGGTVSTSDTVWRYTFDLSGADYSLSPRQYGCHGNVIAPLKLQDTVAGRERQWLNNITFGNTQNSSQCWSNKFLERCHSMSFGNGCYANTFGQYCYYNTFGQNCYGNTFGQSCYRNTFGQYCYYNTFGQNCYGNTFGQNCYGNTFGQNCCYNTFGQDCCYNTFGQSCYRNTFGQSCGSNTFGQSCGSNTFGQYCYYNTFGQDCWYNTFGQGVGYFCADLPNSLREHKPISIAWDSGKYTVSNPGTASRTVDLYIAEYNSDTSEIDVVVNTQVTLAAGSSQEYSGGESGEPDGSIYAQYVEGNRKFRVGLYW